MDNVFTTLRDLQLGIIRLRNALQRVPGDAENELAAVTLRQPLQQIEDATRDVERWLGEHQKFVMQQATIHYPDQEGE